MLPLVKLPVKIYDDGAVKPARVVFPGRQEVSRSHVKLFAVMLDKFTKWTEPHVVKARDIVAILAAGRNCYR